MSLGSGVPAQEVEEREEALKEPYVEPGDETIVKESETTILSDLDINTGLPVENPFKPDSEIDTGYDDDDTDEERDETQRPADDIGSHEWERPRAGQSGCQASALD